MICPRDFEDFAAMDFFILTIFPEIFDSFFACGMIRLAIEKGIITATPMDIREHAQGRHRVTDDRPYGGGAGMVMKPEPLVKAITDAKSRAPYAKTILLGPQGRPFDQPLAGTLSREEGLILVCGRYEGMDERVYDHVDAEISIGDYILTGGEVAAMVLVDALTRLIPGVLGCGESAEKDSFADNLLEHAHYTRPPVFENQYVPEVLTSGNHAAIADWRMESSLVRTLLKRPDLLKDRKLDDREKQILKKWCDQVERLVDA